jgi:hypothetical protein
VSDPSLLFDEHLLARSLRVIETAKKSPSTYRITAKVPLRLAGLYIADMQTPLPLIDTSGFAFRID